MKQRPDDSRNKDGIGGGRTFVIPLNVPFGFPSDYATKTAQELGHRGSVLLFGFRDPVPVLTWLTHPQSIGIALAAVRSALSGKKGTIVHIRPPALIPFQRYSPVMNMNIALGIRVLSILLRLIHAPKPVVWGFHPLVAMFAHLSPDVRIVYDCVDYYGAELGDDGPMLRRMEQRLVRTADLVACNSTPLLTIKRTEYPKIREKSFTVPCGCDTELFVPGRTTGRRLRPVVGSIGHINHRIDFRLLWRLACQHPDWDFRIAGGVLSGQPEDQAARVTEWVDRLAALPNVRLSGPIPKHKAPDFIRSLDVCIIPYDTRYASVRYCNPMKAYEYLSCGKPVVSSDIPALRAIPDTLLARARSAEAFGRAIGMFLKQPPLTRRAIGVARTHSWRNKIDAVMERLIRLP